MEVSREELMELAYKSNDFVMYRNGYDKGKEDACKQTAEEIAAKVDKDRLLDEYMCNGHPCDFQVLAYRKGVEDVLEAVR